MCLIHHDACEAAAEVQLYIGEEVQSIRLSGTLNRAGDLLNTQHYNSQHYNQSYIHNAFLAQQSTQCSRTWSSMRSSASLLATFSGVTNSILMLEEGSRILRGEGGGGDK